jgi:sugar phosphate isomerase/epimerase
MMENMKYAFSTNCCPQWDAPTIAAHAKELGYQGVEAAATEQIERISQELAANGAVVACVCCDLAGGSNRHSQEISADQVRQAIQTAQSVDCHHVKIAGLAPLELSKLAKWLQPLGDAAVTEDVTLVIENQPPFANAHAMWLLLEAVNHPAIAAAWDVCTAANAGESPWVSVPNLNSRIAYTMVRDARISEANAIPCPFGQGDVPLQPFVARLMGVGFQGWIAVQSDGGVNNSPAIALAEALAKLRNWSKPPEIKRPPHRTAPVRQ